MRLGHLLTTSAMLEMVTGIGLLLFPDVIATLLFSQDLYGAGVVIGRVAGFALIALGWVFWNARNAEGMYSISTAMFGYNGVVALYLATVGIADGLTGILLWPAVAIHTALALACAQLWFKRQLDSQ